MGYGTHMSQFEPSPASLTPQQKALLTLRYVQKVAACLETYVVASGEDQALPSWVLTRINQAGSSLGATMSFLTFKKDSVAPKESAK